MNIPASVAKASVHPLLIALPVGLWVVSLLCDLLYLGGSVIGGFPPSFSQRCSASCSGFPGRRGGGACAPSAHHRGFSQSGIWFIGCPSAVT